MAHTCFDFIDSIIDPRNLLFAKNKKLAKHFINTDAVARKYFKQKGMEAINEMHKLKKAVTK